MLSTRPKRFQHRTTPTNSGTYNQKPFPGSRPSQGLLDEEEYLALGCGELSWTLTLWKVIKQWVNRIRGDA